jgi:DNA helicase-2/ATP-dependent DNA helicase PcrA
MTRAMDTLVITRAQYRRRYGNDAPEASLPSRFLEEIPSRLMENLGTPLGTTGYGWNASFSGRGPGYGYGGSRFGGNFRTGLAAGADEELGSAHYSYEDEDQSGGMPGRTPLRAPYAGVRSTPYPNAAAKPSPVSKPAEKQPDSLDNIAQFFAGRTGGAKPGGSFSRPKMEIAVAPAPKGLMKGSRVRHGKYGEGQVILREGDGEDAKLTVHFQKFGVKKLIEKFAQLEKL